MAANWHEHTQIHTYIISQLLATFELWWAYWGAEEASLRYLTELRINLALLEPLSHAIARQPMHVMLPGSIECLYDYPWQWMQRIIMRLSLFLCVFSHIYGIPPHRCVLVPCTFPSVSSHFKRGCSFLVHLNHVSPWGVASTSHPDSWRKKELVQVLIQYNDLWSRASLCWDQHTTSCSVRYYCGYTVPCCRRGYYQKWTNVPYVMLMEHF